MIFKDECFVKFKFTKEQIKKNLENAIKDLDIAKQDPILDVKFNYSYNALIKSGIALLSFYQIKVRSLPGHHIKILEKMAEALKDDSIADTGNAMRSKRNMDFYGGGVEITNKECREYVEFVGSVILKTKHHIGQ